jgi:endonuclease III
MTSRKLTAEQQRVATILSRLAEYAQWDPDDQPLPVDALVGTILSQNTSDINSERAYLRLREHYASWDDVADADPTALADVIRVGGLADQKARTIIAALRKLRERHGGFALEHYDTATDEDLLRELTAMKGIGLKTAACVLMFSLGRDLCAIDTHIHRVANRLGLVDTANPDKTFHELRPQIPPGEARNLHVALIRFGRKICKSQRPHCFECPLFDLCRWELKEEVAREGLPGPRAASGDVVLADILRHGPRRKPSGRS